ncbi:MAG TPA: hypothetical protein VEP91_01675 [Solirubrobacterales bacterium]|nr:hypothetical protein [Solirubrobacterales bacterium]
MSLRDWENRPPDQAYYVDRGKQLRQGDLFRDIPLGYPMPPDAVDHEEGKRKFLSGPFEPGFGMLISPTCSMHAQGTDGGYAHPVRMLAPVLSIEHLLERGAIKEAALKDLQKYDHLANYLYLPPIEDHDFPASLALLYGAITIHHDYLEERRIAQLSAEAAVHLKFKLTAFFGGSLFSHEDFDDDGD